MRPFRQHRIVRLPGIRRAGRVVERRDIGRRRFHQHRGVK